MGNGVGGEGGGSCPRVSLFSFSDLIALKWYHRDLRGRLKHKLQFTADGDDPIFVDDGKGGVYLCSKTFKKTSAGAFDGLMLVWSCPHGSIVGFEFIRAKEGVSKIATVILERFSGVCKSAHRPLVSSSLTLASPLLHFCEARTLVYDFGCALFTYILQRFPENAMMIM